MSLFFFSFHEVSRTCKNRYQMLGEEDCLKHMEIIRKAFSEKYSGSRLKGQMFDQIL